MITVNINGEAIPKNPKIHQLVLDRNGSKQVAKKGMMQIMLTKKIMRRVIFKKIPAMKWFCIKATNPFIILNKEREYRARNKAGGIMNKEQGILNVFLVLG